MGLLILYELRAGERLSLERGGSTLASGQGVQFQCRLFRFGPGIDI